MGEKPDDRWCTPLCGPVMYLIGPPLIGCHAEQHSMNEDEFWRKSGKNPFQIAQVLYEKFGTTLIPRKKKLRKPREARPKTKRPPGPKQKIASRPFPKGKRKMR